jgi:hypothetical protein
MKFFPLSDQRLPRDAMARLRRALANLTLIVARDGGKQTAALS